MTSYSSFLPMQTHALLLPIGLQPHGSYGCAILYYVLDAQLFHQPYPIPHSERGFYKLRCLFVPRDLLLTENIHPGNNFCHGKWRWHTHAITDLLTSRVSYMLGLIIAY